MDGSLDPDPETAVFAFAGAFLAAPEKLSQVPGVTPEIIQAGAIGSRWAYAAALQHVWLVSITFGAVAIVACIFLGNLKPYMTNRIAATVA